MVVAASGATLLLSPEEVSAQEESVLEDTTTNELLASAAATASPAVDWQAILQKASKRALGGGKAGATAAVVQVLSLMWLRTSMNYQYAKGGDLGSSLKELWNEGGIPRLYQGLPFALVQGPLTRFGDTAIFLMPIDSSKTAMQVEGKDGIKNLWGLVKVEGPAPLYYGALAQASATAAGHFPWFLTYNFVDANIPAISSSDDLLLSLGRSALLGLCASCVSDICSNSLRVIKTTKQTARLQRSDDNTTSNQELSYSEVVKMIIEKDGIAGLFGRGLQTRLLTNAIQGSAFSVLWKYFQLQS
ncbi:MAG: hypothetical protein SGARI_001696 [Bacillariaceae sp.]